MQLKAMREIGIQPERDFGFMAGSYIHAEAQEWMEDHNEAMKELPFGKGMEPNPKSLQAGGDVSVPEMLLTPKPQAIASPDRSRPVLSSQATAP